MRYCKFCLTEHPLTSEFWNSLRTSPQCKAYQRHWRRSKPLAAKQRDYANLVAWRKANPDKLKKIQNACYHRNSKKIVQKNYEYARKRRAVDPNYNLTIVLRQRLYRALKGQYKTGSAVSDLGCSIDDFRIYIETRFQPGMTWENHGRTGWHIDHIIPISSFDLSNPEEFKRAVHYTNLQPLWAHENHQKSNKQ
jgi:hypothetical protein